MRQYTITEGSYSSYRIVAQVQGPDRPALSTLWKNFLLLHGHIDQKTDYKSARDLLRLIEQESALKDATEYIGGDSIAERFITWLLENYKFIIIPSNEFWAGFQ